MLDFILVLMENGADRGERARKGMPEEGAACMKAWSPVQGSMLRPHALVRNSPTSRLNS